MKKKVLYGVAAVLAAAAVALGTVSPSVGAGEVAEVHGTDREVAKAARGIRW